MKKLLFVLLIVALASYLLVGCMPVTPSEGEGEGEGEAEICPTVAITSQFPVGGKTYIKAGSQTITVTFAVPTEPVSVYVGSALKADGLLTPGEEVVMYPDAAKKVYTGKFPFGVSAKDCAEAYIYVETCDACAYCKYPYIVDKVGPETEITITSKKCVCDGSDLIFKTPAQSAVCGVTGVCCGDDCSGFASYSIDLYKTDPFNLCCDIPCATPAYSCTAGVACPVDCTIPCVLAGKYYVIATLLDAAGNRTRYYAIVELDAAGAFTVTEYTQNKVPTGGTVAVCTDWTVEVDTDTTIGICFGVNNNS